MGKIAISVLLMFFFNQLLAQEQPFKNGFIFRPGIITNTKDSLFLLREDSKKVVSKIGYLEKSGENILLETDSAYIEFVHVKDLSSISAIKPVVGLIKHQNKDSLFIQFKQVADSVDKEDSLYVLKITDWRKSRKGTKHYDIPYRNNQFTIVNFPFRVNLKDGTVETAFVNAAVNIARIFGKARVYKSSFYEPRYRYCGAGIMFGVGAREDTSAKNEVSVVIGGTFVGSIYGIKLITALGWETGLKSTSKKGSLSFGIGFGLDIFSILSPEIKKKDE